MSKQLHPHKILWLASYLKSGNTWFRAFLTALINDGEVNINKMGSDGIFSSREIFDNVSEISSRDLYDCEVKSMVADAYRDIAAEKNALSIIKAHDFFGIDPQGNNLIPEDVTHCAIYFIRNPLDIAGSLANHMDADIQVAVDMLNNSNSFIADQLNNLNKSMQMTQYLSDWSRHVNSWTLKPKFPVLVVRYEDMMNNTFETFKRALKFIGWEYPDEKILRAIEASNFEELSRQENENGFKEKASKKTNFFRSGVIGNWKNELTTEQADQIISMHRTTMMKYNFILSRERVEVGKY